MANQEVLRSLLQDVWDRGRLRNPSYSLRAFSTKLGISPAALSEILNGKRAVSAKMVERLLTRIEIDPETRLKVFQRFHQQRTPIEFSNLSVDQYHLIADWYHLALLSLAETRDFQSDPEWISKRLRVPKRSILGAIERLIRLGLLLKDSQSGALSVTGQWIKTPDEIANSASRKGHGQDLELARASLERDSIQDRDFTAMTMAINPEKIPLAKQMIRELLKNVSETLESGPQSEVYKLAVYFYPLTELVSKGKNHDPSQ